MVQLLLETTCNVQINVEPTENDGSHMSEYGEASGHRDQLFML